MKEMKKSVTATGVQLDTAMYLTRVITFDLQANGTDLSIFKSIENMNRS